MFRYIFSLAYIATVLVASGPVTAQSVQLKDKFEAQLASDLLRFVSTGNQSALLNDNLDHIKFPWLARKRALFELPASQKANICRSCRIAVGSIISLVGIGARYSEVENRAVDICKILNIGEPIVCRNVVAFNLPAVTYIIRNTPGLKAETICANLLQGQCTSNDKNREFSVAISNNGPAITGSKQNIPTGKNELTLVHISDPHYDPKYQPGSNAVCNYPMCCRADMGNPETPEKAAGRWGDYRDCDMPWESIQNAFDQIKANHKKIDAVYMTGDFIDHAVWDTSFRGNYANIKNTSDAMRAAFPNVPLYPAIGNHEPHPLNLFSPNTIKNPVISTNELYKFLAKTWYWLPQSAKDTLISGGYYTDLVRAGLRVIVLNTNVCNTYNFWNLHDLGYVQAQLQWLHDVLLKAEAAGEKVHIVGHMNSGGGDCLSVYGREYRRIVDRFWNTISGQFVGHTHKDEFNLHYARENSNHAINVVWNGGSLTTYSNVNPNYRLYSVEAESFQVTDHETWIYNITEANLPGNSPRWYQEYTFKNYYSVPDLSPASLDRLVNEFATNKEKLHSHWLNYVKRGDTSLGWGCDNSCLADVLCRAVTTEYLDRSKCNQLTSSFFTRYGQ